MTIPSSRIGADFPPSWYLIVAMPGAVGDVVVKDILSEKERSESDVDVKDEGDTGSGLWVRFGGETVREFVKRPVTG